MYCRLKAPEQERSGGMHCRLQAPEHLAKKTRAQLQEAASTAWVS